MAKKCSGGRVRLPCLLQHEHALRRRMRSASFRPASTERRSQRNRTACRCSTRWREHREATATGSGASRSSHTCLISNIACSEPCDGATSESLTRCRPWAIAASMSSPASGLAGRPQAGRRELPTAALRARTSHGLPSSEPLPNRLCTGCQQRRHRPSHALAVPEPWNVKAKLANSSRAALRKLRCLTTRGRDHPIRASETEKFGDDERASRTNARAAPRDVTRQLACQLR